MPHTLNQSAWLEAALLVGFCIFLTRKYLPTAVAVLVVLIRFAIPIAYFQYYFRGAWIGIDANTYANGGAKLLTSGYNVFTVLFTASGFRFAQVVAGDRIKIGPFLWNLLWFSLFGIRICVPVLANVAATLVAGFFLYRIVILCGGRPFYAKVMAAAMLLHPMMICYSSFADLKDSLVLCLLLMMLYYLLLLARRFSLRSILWLAVISLVLTSVRYYAALPVVVAFGLWLTISEQKLQKIWLVPVAVVGAAAVARLIHLSARSSEVLRDLQPQQILYGIGHFLLTPRPWELGRNVGFLYPAMVLHWIGLPFAVLGAVALWRSSRTARLLLVYAVELTILYALSANALGQYRERYQFYFVFVWAQAHGVWLLWRLLRKLPLRGRPKVSPAATHAIADQVAL
ncbi:MAG: hypothetical protein EPN33_06510 [Acidobacteria bacterium]|nr:MAG: hypothetical protein EPN33_06510 [Acidobacteriota bacterium]